MKQFQYFSKGLLLILMITMISNSTAQQPGFQRSDSLISAYLDEINADSVESYMQFLQDKGTRFLIAPNRKAVAESIRDKFIALGADDARIDSFYCYTKINYQNLHFDTTTIQYNVIGNIFGMLEAEEYLVMGAHYDDVVPLGDPMVFAPGADDNASGVAALFECVRVLSQNEFIPLNTIEFVAFAAEELMYFGNSGAQAYVDTALAHGINMQLMINNDMIAYTASDEWEIKISNYIGSQWLTGIAGDITQNYTEITPKVSALSGQAGADCKYFYEAGVPCVYFMEEDFNPWYHTEDDLVENAKMDYCTEAVKISLGTLIQLQDTTTTSVDQIPELICKVYPNPTNGLLKVKVAVMPGQGNACYSLTDLQGKMLANGTLNPGAENLLKLNKFADGLYFLTINSGNSVTNQKIILRR